MSVSYINRDEVRRAIREELDGDERGENGGEWARVERQRDGT